MTKKIKLDCEIAHCLCSQRKVLCVSSDGGTHCSTESGVRRSCLSFETLPVEDGLVLDVFPNLSNRNMLQVWIP